MCIIVYETSNLYIYIHVALYQNDSNAEIIWCPLNVLLYTKSYIIFYQLLCALCAFTFNFSVHVCYDYVKAFVINHV